MRWSVVIPGQPVSWDAAYRIGKMPVRRKDGPVFNADGSRKFIHRPVKVDEAQVYQDTVQLLVQNACPSGWRPKGQVRVYVEMWLGEDIDCDNATKLLFDAAAKAIGCNDRQFIPCYWKATGQNREAQGVRLIFDDSDRALSGHAHG